MKVAVIALSVIALLFIEASMQGRFGQLIKIIDDDGLGGGLLLAGSQTGEESCPADAERVDEYRLVRAIFLVERLAVPGVKRWAARWLVRLSLIAGIDPPDFSLGMGQIKLSTLTKLRDQAKSRGEAVEMPAPLELVEQLEDWCKGQDLGVQLVSRLYGVKLGDDRLIPRSEILRAAALWNGQGRSARIEAVIANARYRELVYETMVALRFAQQSGSAN